VEAVGFGATADMIAKELKVIETWERPS
jgi:hypothetical protein